MKFKQRTLAFVISILMAVSLTTTAFAAQGLPALPEPLDSQSWLLQRDMTWDDWVDNPFDWDEVEVEPEMTLKGALILVDFKDRPFIVTMEKGSELIGNPVIDAVPEDELAQFWEDFLNTPSELNNYVSIHEYWRENSYGKWAIEIDAYGPFHIDGYEFEYGIDSSMNQMSGSKNLGQAAYNLAKAAGVPFTGYDFFFVLHSGYDESGVWQELGEMKFLTQDDVTDEFGPSQQFLDAIADPASPTKPRPQLKEIWDGLGYIPNWLPTRYVPWSSYYAALGVWSGASSIRDGSFSINFSVQGENDGMATFAHEFGHIKGLPDNYNNPYGTGSAFTRSYTGPWELMSRGSFGGPGGPHERWQIPSTMGSSVPAPHLLYNSIRQGFVDEDKDLVNINRDELVTTGPVFADIVARVVPSGSHEYGVEGYRGLRVTMDQDYTPTITDITVFDRIGTQKYKYYDVEVVDKVGYDSFALDSGVLISKSRDSGSPRIWMIDAHPEDISLVDFVRPDGTEAMISIGDMNQLADAAFKVGTAEGVVNEYVDEYNKLHFYILDKNYDDQGVLRYRVGVRNLEGAGDFERGLSIEKGELIPATPGNVAVQYFNITNTGEATDIFRVEASTEGWGFVLLNNLYEVKAGETIEVPVYVQIPQNAKGVTTNNITLKATSETDSEQSESFSVVLNHSPGKAKGKIE